MARKFGMNLANEMRHIQQKTVEMNKEKKLVWLNPRELIDDEDNEFFYGDYQEDVETLSRSIRLDGFSEVIFAYRTGEKYKIRSGHRRKYAAIKAGVDLVPIVLEPAPKTDYDRVMRLLDSNNNKREDKPMVLARTASKYFEIIQERRTNDPEYAKKVKGTSTKELVADKMGKSAALVSRYASLMKLIPELQDKANDEVYSWSALSSAASLSEDKQYIVNAILEYEVGENGPSIVKRDWLNNIIAQLKDDMFTSVEEYKCLTVRQSNVEQAYKNIEDTLGTDWKESSSNVPKTDGISVLYEKSAEEKGYDKEPSIIVAGIEQETTTKKPKKENKVESIRNHIFSLNSLLEANEQMSSKELELIRPSLFLLQTTIEKILNKK